MGRMGSNGAMGAGSLWKTWEATSSEGTAIWSSPTASSGVGGALSAVPNIADYFWATLEFRLGY
jgi:hypothetical protein